MILLLDLEGELAVARIGRKLIHLLVELRGFH